MNLYDVRQQFIVRSGRYDLEQRTRSGAVPADFFIQAGQRFLDRRSNVQKSQNALLTKNIRIGESFVPLESCWYIDKVRLLDEEKNAWETLSRIHSKASIRYAMRSRGTPLYWLITTPRSANDLVSQAVNTIQENADTFTAPLTNAADTMIEILPAPYKEFVLEVTGKFYSVPLTQDLDSSFWSELYPDLLVKAALYQLEIFYRNSEGASDWLNSIQLDLIDIEQQELLQDIQGKDVMGGFYGHLT